MIKNDHVIKIYYRDVDQMGIVYYSRYLEYFEEARTELLVSLGLDVPSIEKEGIKLPVVTSHCDYKKGARLEEELRIETFIDKTPKATLLINYKISNNASGEINVTGYTKHAFIDNESHPIRVPNFIKDKLAKYF